MLTKRNKWGIIKESGEKMLDVETERKRIIDGEYPTRVIQGKQRKHIKGTIEFEQNRSKMQCESPGSEPSILNADAQRLVDKYKGKGVIRLVNGSQYPQETIDTDEIVGMTWVRSMQKYVKTSRIRIVYSSTGVHIIPVSDYQGG